MRERSAFQPSPSTKAYYLLNGNANDVSGQNNVGTPTAITYPQGRFGQAARFNGSSSVIGIPYNGLNFEYNNSFTFSCWTQITTSAGEFAFFSNLKNDSTLRGWEVNKAFNSPNVGFYLLSNWDGGSGPRLAVQFNTNLVKNKLVNLVITYSGNSLASGVKCYVDGMPQTVASSAETLSTNTTVHTDNPKLGARISGNSRLNGLLDEVIIESRAWTAKEVETYYRKSNLNYKQSKFAQFLQSINITDTMSLLDVTTGIRSRVVNVTDTLGMTDTISAIRAYVVNLIDTMNLSDTLTSLRTMALSITDSLGLTDSVNAKKRWDNQTKGTSTFSNQSKGTSTFSNQTKDSSSWTNQNKEL